jgi:hypothetical protein
MSVKNSDTIFFLILYSFRVLLFKCPYCPIVLRAVDFFQYEKSDGFGRERTRDLGFQRPARKPLDHRSRLSGIDPATFRFVAQCLNHCTTAHVEV